VQAIDKVRKLVERIGNEHGRGHVRWRRAPPKGILRAASEFTWTSRLGKRESRSQKKLAAPGCSPGQQIGGDPARILRPQAQSPQLARLAERSRKSPPDRCLRRAVTYYCQAQRFFPRGISAAVGQGQQSLSGHRMGNFLNESNSALCASNSGFGPGTRQTDARNAATGRGTAVMLS